MSGRFRSSLESLGCPPDAVIGIAVSGGPDSLALLVLAATDRPGRVRAATVDHGLRPEARDEAEMVAAACARLSVPHDILAVTVQGSVQAGARDARYRALGDWCGAHDLGWLATAHHADDQAETLLMRLARGAGLSGLAGVRSARTLSPQARLIRPLLDWRKAELEQIAAEHGLCPVIDPSNTDPAYDRTAFRALLAASDLFDPHRLSQSAANLADAEAAIEWATDRAFTERVEGASLDPADLPAEIIRRLVLRIFATFGERPRGPELTRLIAALHEGRSATLGSVKATAGTRWVFTPAPPRRGK